MMAGKPVASAQREVVIFGTGHQHVDQSEKKNERSRVGRWAGGEGGGGRKATCTRGMMHVRGVELVGRLYASKSEVSVHPRVHYSRGTRHCTRKGQRRTKGMERKRGESAGVRWFRGRAPRKERDMVTERTCTAPVASEMKVERLKPRTRGFEVGGVGQP